MKKKITVIVNGVEVEYTLLFDVNDEKTGKQYSVYTDNKLNENGKANVYLARRDGDKILPVSDDEKKELEKLVNIVQEEVCNEN